MNYEQEIELELEVAKAAVNRQLAVERLMTNPDFKQIVIDGFLKEEAVRLVHLKGDKNYQDSFNQEMISKQMDCIGFLNGYFQVIKMQSDISEKAIREYHQELGNDSEE